MKKKIGKALVVGAGIGGIRAALDLAETGYGVTLIDKAPHIGGILSRLDHQFPTDHCGMCKMLPLVDRDGGAQFCLRKGLFHENIEILTGTRVTGIAGEPGHFQVSLRSQPTWVDPERCVGCGACVPVCPVEVPDDFNAGLGRRKAIHLPVPHQVPNAYVIDLAACNRCGACQEACPCEAVTVAAADRSDFRILVVDDERIMRESLQAWLEEEGFAVTAADSGPAALEALERESFHLMLADVKMPGMDGVELLEKVKALRPETTAIMMTAYAAVETAVEAMKIGAVDYLVKPFDPESLVPMVLRIYAAVQASQDRQIEVGAVVLAGGTAFFDPRGGPNTYRYGEMPQVVTSLEFERILSGSGPVGGRLVRPHDGRPIRKIAWLQCVGSRDIQCEADFCSSICCMYAVKEALLAKEKGGPGVDTAIYYMDMRCFGKSFQRYRDRAEAEHGVRFHRGRVHSIAPDPAGGDPSLRFVGVDGRVADETFDLVVLAVGQRPAAGFEELAAAAGLSSNPWGFVNTAPLSAVRTDREGITAAGAFAGLRDIAESVIYASAAAAEAARVLHVNGGSLAVADDEGPAYRDVSRQPPRALAVVCTCGGRITGGLDRRELERRLGGEPDVEGVVFVERACTAEGWEAVAAAVEAHAPNRLLLGSCHPYVFVRRLRQLGRRTGLDPVLMEVVDLLGPHLAAGAVEPPATLTAEEVGRDLGMAMARLRREMPAVVAAVPVCQRALVVGGGIAGMTAALAIADRGYPVDLVEARECLGGNLHWIRRTLDGHPLRPLLEESVARVEKHPRIAVHLESGVGGAFGQVGRFYSTLTTADGTARTVEHGAVVLATGGDEARCEAYGCGRHPAVTTQKGFEERSADGGIDPQKLTSVVFIQCAGTREEPRNYCSRVCCATALKQALALKEANPEIDVFVIYRDMMTYGFSETFFTRARREGVVFVPYAPDQKPRVDGDGDGRDGPVIVKVDDPILGRPVAITADLVVLAAGVVPRLPADLAGAYGAELDQDGFFLEAESKWRPVDALTEGVFACGLALAPRNVEESVASAMAAAQRALRILERESLPAARLTAEVRHSLCARCERCIEACPYGARGLDPDLEKILVNPAACQGCGACAAVCPNGAAVLHGLSAPQMLDAIGRALAR